MKMNIFINILFIVTGLAILVISIKNWDWYFNSTPAQRLIRLIGRTGTRILYSIGACLLLLYGVASIIGWI